jgi:ElaB/YqjD/DUF883 family membrane-anchored ribosome-binding protein
MAEETRLTARPDLPASRANGLHDESAAQLRANIEQTRAEMSDTLNQIQDRLNPARLKAQAKEKVRDATIGRMKQMARNAGDKAGDAGRGIIDVVRDNPVPIALIGLGAGWLFMNSRRRERSNNQNDRLLTEREPVGYEAATPRPYAYTDNRSVEGTTEQHGGVANNVREKAGEAGETVKHAAHEAGDKVRDVAHRVADAAQNVRSKVSDGAHGVTHRVSDAAGSVAHRVSDAASGVAHGAENRAMKLKYEYEESPWMGGVVALALGAAAGLALPSTEPERRIMGEKRDELLDRVSDTAREKLNAVRSVASEVVADARESIGESVRTHAREEGLTSSSSEDRVDTRVDSSLGY